MASAQVFNTSAGFGFYGEPGAETYPAFRIGIEGASSKHWSLSGEAHWGGKSNIYNNEHLYDKSFFGMDANLNFYVKEVLQGFYLSAGGFYVLEDATMAENDEELELPARLRAGSEGGVQLGLGFSQRITSKLNLALRSSLRLGGMSPGVFLGFGVGYDFLGKD